MANRLAAESSPYLRQHADNPVDWYPWGEEAFVRARGDDKPVLLSVGYSACHWCHVMAHESFEDPEIAALMNELFVNIKVDREERPDIDGIYMQAVQAMSGHGGWPMTVFLTPDQVPFFGGTYFPPEDRMGMRGFPHVLRAIADAYRSQRDRLREGAQQMIAALQPPRFTAGAGPSEATLDAAAEALIRDTDMRYGGFGKAPKFPHPMAVDLLLRRFRDQGEPRLLTAAEVTLDRMARGGMHDQVGGGFHRYSVDGTWNVPHFEKMLYDNAQLVPAYLHAYQLTGRADFARVVHSTLDYLTKELRLHVGGFAASQDADSEGGEGAFFVWRPEELRAALGEDDGELAARVFGVTAAGNFEHGTTVLSLPYPLRQVATALGMSEPELEHRMDELRTRLYEARRTRPAPGRDDKVVTSWNALAVAAFAEAGAVLQRQDYLVTARQCAEFLLDALLSDGVVHRSWLQGQARVAGFLEDYAHLADALLTLYEAAGEPRYFAAARQLAHGIVDRFRGDDAAYYDTARDAEPLLVRPRSIDDNPVTSGQSAAAHAFIRLHALTGDDSWRGHALEILSPLTGVLERAPLAVASLAAAVELAVAPPREVAIAGAAHDPATQRLVHAVWRHFDTRRVLAWGEPGSVPLMQDRVPRDGRPAAYVCERFVCAAPVSDAASLERLLHPAAPVSA